MLTRTIPVLSASPEPLPIRRSPPARMRRLHDTVAGPLVIPEHPAVSGGDADRARPIHEHDLLDSVDGCGVRGAVSPSTFGAEPPQVSSRRVVGGQRPGSGSNHDVAKSEWRACDAPVRNRCARVGCCITRPQHATVADVERVENSCRTERVDATAVDCRCRARTRAGVRFPEPRRVAMCPYRFAGPQVVGRYDLVFAALFLREQAIVCDGERRPTRANRPAP